jgi:HEAT repeat protein
MSIRILIVTLLLTGAAPALDAQVFSRSAPPAPPTPPAALAPARSDFAYTSSSDGLFGPTLQRFPQDPADSLYRAARTLLNRGDWRKAAETFAAVARHQPPSAYAADALYWQAFALYRIGGTAELRTALGVLDTRRTRYANARSESEAATLTTRIQGALAARGDAGARAALTRSAGARDAICDSEEISVRSSALSALQRSDPEAARELLGRILGRTDECSVPLRRTAVSMLGRADDAAARTRLSAVVRSDPSASVRSAAVGELARSDSEESVPALEAVIRNDNEEESVRRSAVRALGGSAHPRARAAIRALVERSSAPEALRLEAIASFDRSSFGLTYTSAAVTSSFGGRAVTVAPVPPVPPVPPAAPVAPVAPVRGTVSTVVSGQERAVLEAELAHAVAVSGEHAAVLDEVRWQQASASRDRRISAEDATWLRGVYPRLETSRLKSRAVSVLARARDEPTQVWMMALVQNENESASIRATALSRLGRDLPIAQLGRLYDEASNRTVRQQVISTLGSRKEPEATDKLIAIVRSDTDPRLRQSALGALQRKDDPRTTKLLMELIDR